MLTEDTSIIESLEQNIFLMLVFFIYLKRYISYHKNEQHFFSDSFLFCFTS